MFPGEIHPRVVKFFFGLEIISWILTTILTLVTVGFTIYQLSVLYVPYWAHLLNDAPGTQFEFPEYFYRVYGDNVSSLNYEHYGYLLAAAGMSVVTSICVIPHHPFKNSLPLHKKID